MEDYLGPALTSVQAMEKYAAFAAINAEQVFRDFGLVPEERTPDAIEAWLAAP